MSLVGAAAPPAHVERLAGPAGASVRTANWDSVLLQLTESDPSDDAGPVLGQFSLELWRYYEAWRVPLGASAEAEGPVAAQGANSRAAAGSAGAAAPDSFRAPGQPRASVLEREESRATYQGTFRVSQVGALRFAGFEKAGLNQTFVEEPHLLVDGVPTWWSEDGRFFFYYAAQYGHWKANATRVARGDGLRAVGSGRRRTGRGFAHSGPASTDTQPGAGGVGALETEAPPPPAAVAAAALARAEGWFEVLDGEWAPAQPEVAPVMAWRLDFRADTVAAEELVACGEDSSEARQSLGPIVFHGVRFDGARSGNLRLCLPPPPEQEDEAGEMQPAAGAMPSTEEDGAVEEVLVTGLGDPDMVLLRPEGHPSSKL